MWGNPSFKKVATLHTVTSFNSKLRHGYFSANFTNFQSTAVFKGAEVT